jgi:vesicular inhibitory amino acid transporter
VWPLISVALVWLPSQFTTLKYVSYLAIPSAAAIVLAALMIIVQLLLESDGFGKQTSAGTPPTAPGKSDFEAFLTTYSAFSSIVFAFQGQDMFCEMIHDMEDQSQAIQAVTTSYILMGSNYLFMTTMAYGAKGSTVADFLPDALPPGPTKSVVNLLVAFHVIVAYVITSNVVCKVFYSVLFKSTPLSHASTKPWSESWTIRTRWLLLTSCLSIFAFIIANLIPAFGAFQGLLGAFCAAPIVFGFPALFLYLGHRHHDCPLRNSDMAICSLFFFVLMPSMMTLGTIGAVYEMMDALRTAGMPFACGPTVYR